MIGLYNKNNECVSEIFYNNHINFVPFKPIQVLLYYYNISAVFDDYFNRIIII